jgi:hypothetical protein
MHFFLVFFDGFNVLVSKMKKYLKIINYFDAFSRKKHPTPQYQTLSKLQLLQNRFSENFEDTL